MRTDLEEKFAVFEGTCNQSLQKLESDNKGKNFNIEILFLIPLNVFFSFFQIWTKRLRLWLWPTRRAASPSSRLQKLLDTTVKIASLSGSWTLRPTRFMDPSTRALECSQSRRPACTKSISTVSVATQRKAMFNSGSIRELKLLRTALTHLPPFTAPSAYHRCWNWTVATVLMSILNADACAKMIATNFQTHFLPSCFPIENIADLKFYTEIYFFLSSRKMSLNNKLVK